MKQIPWTEGRASQAERIAQRCDCFHQRLKKGRNKLLAHNDLKTALAGQEAPFPRPPSIGKDVIEQLELLIKLASEQCGLPSTRVVLRSDEREIIKALKDSLLYERALKDPRLPEELRTEMLLWRLDDIERQYPGPFAAVARFRLPASSPEILLQDRLRPAARSWGRPAKR